MEGVQIGGYRLLRQIGEGGMGSVWLAEHVALGRQAAIKLLHPMYSSRKDILPRFFNEARAAASVSDPGIVQIFDFGHHADGTAYIVMELLDGEPLDRRLRRGSIPLPEALRIMRQIANSLGVAHARGIVHRDLKPENIFMVRDIEVPGGQRPKILDFGIAKLFGDSTSQTNTTAMLGTPMYMSPEQCRGAGYVDERSDVYSLGCLLFRMIAGRPPFEAEGHGELIAMHLREKPPRLSRVVSKIPSSVDALVARCLDKDPAQRFATGAALAEAINRLALPLDRITGPALDSSAASSKNTTLSASASTTTFTPTPRSRRWITIALVATIPILVFGAVWIETQKARPDPSLTARTPPPSTPPEPAAHAVATGASPPVDASVASDALAISGPTIADRREATPANHQVGDAAGSGDSQSHDSRKPLPSRSAKSPTVRGSQAAVATSAIAAATPAPKTTPSSVEVTPRTPSPSTTATPGEKAQDSAPPMTRMTAKQSIDDEDPPGASHGAASAHAPVREQPGTPPRTPAVLPQKLDRNLIAGGLAGVRDRIHICGETFAGAHIAVSAKVSPTGQVDSVTVKNSPDPWLTSCVTKGMKAAVFPTTNQGGMFSTQYQF